MKRLRRAALLATLPALLAATAMLPPMLPPKVDGLSPLGGRRGTEVELTLRGQRLGEPLALLCTRPGIEVLALAAGKDAGSCTAKLRLAADCALGPQPLRLRTQSGLSNLCQFFVGALPEIQEQRTGDAGQPVEPDCTIDGAIKGEETDRYTVDLPAGAHLVAEVEAMRLGRGPIDLALSVLAPDGSVLARADDTALGHKDPWLAFDARAPGRYEVRVAAAFADGQNEGAYRLHLGQLPRPVAALPCGGAPGQTFEVTLLGDREPWRATVALPDAPPGGGDEWFAFYPGDARGCAPTPVWLRVGGPPEVTPQQDGDGPPRVTFPGSVSGVVDHEDGARYRFAAKKGETFELRALATGLHSPLDPVLAVRAGDGKLLAADDDGGGLGDSLLRFAAPADGEFTVEVRDLLHRCSPAHVFRLECGPRPRLSRCRLVVARGQEALCDVPQGGAAGGVLQLDVADNADLDAGLQFALGALPAGVTAAFGRIGKGSNLVPFVLTAALDAPLAGAFAEVGLRAEREPRERDAGYAQVLPLVTVRNDQPILTTVQRRLPVAVTRAAPFTLALTAPRVPLVRGAPLGVGVAVQRAAGWKGDVRVKALWTPPGVGAGEVTVPAGASAGVLPLDANGNAPLGPFVLAVVATSTVGNEGFEQGSTFVEVTVDKPWLTAQVGAARTTAGTPCAVPLELHAEQALQGPLHARLLGLPKGVGAEPLALAADATHGAFALAVAADAATGRFRDLALEIRVPHDGAEVVHRFGVGELRIDAAPPAAAPPANAAPATATKEPPR